VDRDADVVRFGSRAPRGRWLAWLLACAVAAAAIALAVAGRGGRHREPSHQPVVITEVGHPLLGVTAGWELFGRGPDGVVFVQLARGRITRTSVPPLASSGPVSFIVGPHQAVIRPLDFVPGYVVPDGAPARLLPRLPDRGGPVTPGPDPGQVWVVTQNAGHPALSLEGLDGSQTGVSIPLPRGGPSPLTAAPDGDGYVLLTSGHSVYDARPGGLRRVAIRLAAVGPDSWLAVTCRHGRRCRNVLIDTSSGGRHALPGPPVRGSDWPPGVISPDDSAAAVVLISGDGKATLRLIDLSSGASQPVAVPVGEQAGGCTLAWSPDSQWLFAASSHGTVLAVSARTARAAGLGVALPFISQIAIRAAPH
jgi:hypothetical protein